MSGRATLAGSRVMAKPTTIVPGGMADPGRVRFDHLMRTGRPVWADDPDLDLPCQRPGSDPDWWFDAGTGEGARKHREHAIGLCSLCPMREPCRDHAVEAPREHWGIWGGVLMEREGRPPPSRRKGVTT